MNRKNLSLLTVAAIRHQYILDHQIKKLDPFSPKWWREKLPGRRMLPRSVYCRMSVEQIAQKEKSHVVDYRCNSSNPVATRLFGWKHKPKLPENRQLDSHSARYCPHPNRSERVGDYLDWCFVERGEAAYLAASPLYNPGANPSRIRWRRLGISIGLCCASDGISPKWRRTTLPG